MSILKCLNPLAEAKKQNLILQANYLYIRDNLKGHFLSKICTLLSIDHVTFQIINRELVHHRTQTVLVS